MQYNGLFLELPIFGPPLQTLSGKFPDLTGVLVWKDSLNTFFKNLIDEVSKIENIRCTFVLLFHASRFGIQIPDPILSYPVVNCPRMWAVFDFLKKLKISQNVWRKSITKKSGIFWWWCRQIVVSPS